MSVDLKKIIEALFSDSKKSNVDALKKQYAPESDVMTPDEAKQFEIQVRMGDRDDTPDYDPNRKDEFGQPMPMNAQGRQYTQKGLQKVRALDPEWPDRARFLREQHKNDEE